MNILEAILDAQGGATARQAGAAVGLSREDTRSALSALVPALAAGLHRNASSSGGLDALSPARPLTVLHSRAQPRLARRCGSSALRYLHRLAPACAGPQLRVRAHRYLRGLDAG